MLVGDSTVVLGSLRADRETIAARAIFRPWEDSFELLDTLR